MTATADVAKESGPITSPDDARVCWDSDKGTYYLRGSDTGGSGRTILVFVGASVGPIHRKGVLQIRIDPAAVRVGPGEKLRWIIEDLHGQTDTTRIQILQDTAFWPFDGAEPRNDKDTFTAVRDPNAPNKNFVETPGGRKSVTPPPRPDKRVGTKYSIAIEFKENKDDDKSPVLKAVIDPDVVYNPPGF